jgi:hypothetical protein
MKKHAIVFVLLAALFVSMSTPMNADATVFLAAIPVIWAVAGGAIIVASFDEIDDNQQPAQAEAGPNTPVPEDPPVRIASIGTDTVPNR